MRLHVISLPHSKTTAAWPSCAYTQKVRKFATMMNDAGYEVILYASDEHDGRCSELVSCSETTLPDGEPMDWNVDGPLFGPFNKRVIEELSGRIEPQDFICLIGGLAQEPIASAFPNHMAVEFGIGYEGIIPSTYHVFESYAWMHCTLGRNGPYQVNGRFFDCVIPNYFDPYDFPIGQGPGDHLLYMGRLIQRKGLQIIADIAQRTDLPLIAAGGQSDGFQLPDSIHQVGIVGPTERAELMSRARCLLCPTLYIEPFGGVAVEAQMCGTPAISSDWGAFTETIVHGETGFRCHTLQEFLDAIEAAPHLDRSLIRQRAIEQYSMNAISQKYVDYFERLSTLWSDGFYQLRQTVGH